MKIDLEIEIKKIQNRKDFKSFEKRFNLFTQSNWVLVYTPDLNQIDKIFLEDARMVGDAVPNSLVQLWIHNPYRDNCFHDLLWKAKIHGFELK